MKLETKHSEKAGGVLVMVTIVVVTISIMVIGLFQLQARSGVESVYHRQSEQAFWLAEAGIQLTVERLNWSESYRQNPASFTTNLASGPISNSITVSVTSQSDFFSPGTTNYTITSVGYAGTFNRRIRQKVSTSPGSKFAIISNGGSSSFQSNAEIIDGSVAVFNGSLDTGQNEGVVLGDSLYVDSDVTVTGKGDYSESMIPSGLSEPNFDASVHQKEISEVAVNSANVTVPTPVTISDRSIPLISNYTSNNITFSKGLSVPSGGAVITCDGNILFDKTVTFNGPVTIKAGGSVTFTQTSDLPAGSTITAGGSISLAQQTDIGEGVTIKSGGEVEFKSQTTFYNHVLVYAEGNLSLASGATGPSSGDGLAFLSNTSITINSNMNPFWGIMYSNGSITFDSNMDIYGTVVGEFGFTAKSEVDMYFKPEAYQWALLEVGVGINFGDVILTKGTWQELSPL